MENYFRDGKPVPYGMGIGFLCHSEEPAGDEESTQDRWCEDPSQRAVEGAGPYEKLLSLISYLLSLISGVHFRRLPGEDRQRCIR